MLSLAAVAVSLFLAAPSQAAMVESLSGKYLVSYELSPEPLKSGPAELSYDLRDLGDGPANELVKATTRLWMPAMGHGSRPTKTVERGAKGHYEVSGAYFLMPGIWEVIVEAQAADGSVETFKIPVRVTH
ncbi:MAG: FixH family protein [Deltaproteobacteria bacterium]|nr:FixH family protein [Deltaproteobacteria bacterium]